MSSPTTVTVPRPCCSNSTSCTCTPAGSTLSTQQVHCKRPPEQLMQACQSSSVKAGRAVAGLHKPQAPVLSDKQHVCNKGLSTLATLH